MLKRPDWQQAHRGKGGRHTAACRGRRGTQVTDAATLITTRRLSRRTFIWHRNLCIYVWRLAAHSPPALPPPCSL
jgi:hypothetical protein